jgi:hypothetical protein
LGCCTTRTQPPRLQSRYTECSQRPDAPSKPVRSAVPRTAMVCSSNLHIIAEVRPVHDPAEWHLRWRSPTPKQACTARPTDAAGCAQVKWRHAGNPSVGQPDEVCLGPTGGSEGSGGLDTRPARSDVPSPGRWIRSGRFCGSSVLHDCASLDWPTGPHPTPSGSGPRADCGQKQDPGARITLTRD